MDKVIGLIAIAALIIGIRSVFKPWEKLHIKSRKQGGLLIVGGLILASIGANMKESALDSEGAAAGKPTDYAQYVSVSDVYQKVSSDDPLGTDIVIAKNTHPSLFLRGFNLECQRYFTNGQPASKVTKSIRVGSEKYLPSGWGYFFNLGSGEIFPIKSPDIDTKRVDCTVKEAVFVTPSSAKGVEVVGFRSTDSGFAVILRNTSDKPVSGARLSCLIGRESGLGSGVQLVTSELVSTGKLMFSTDGKLAPGKDGAFSYDGSNNPRRCLVDDVKS